jgi:hypothetical protein
MSTANRITHTDDIATMKAATRARVEVRPLWKRRIFVPLVGGFDPQEMLLKILATQQTTRWDITDTECGDDWFEFTASYTAKSGGAWDIENLIGRTIGVTTVYDGKIAIEKLEL